MAIFYFKKSFILALSVLTLQVASAQTAPAKTPAKTASKAAAKPAAAKKAVTLKLDSQGRAYYFDQQGDKVIVLDYKTRRSLQAVSSYKRDEPIKGQLYSKNFYKETAPDFAVEVKQEFDTYTTKEGDTWESISQKLYDTEAQWAQLKLWNEELLNDPKIPEGSTIKYMDIPKN